jgi:hypothetical protein
MSWPARERAREGSGARARALGGRVERLRAKSGRGWRRRGIGVGVCGALGPRRALPRERARACKQAAERPQGGNRGLWPLGVAVVGWARAQAGGAARGGGGDEETTAPSPLRLPLAPPRARKHALARAAAMAARRARGALRLRIRPRARCAARRARGRDGGGGEGEVWSTKSRFRNDGTSRRARPRTAEGSSGPRPHGQSLGERHTNLVRIHLGSPALRERRAREEKGGAKKGVVV